MSSQHNYRPMLLEFVHCQIQYTPKKKVTQTPQTSEISSGTHFNEQAYHEHAS